MKHLRWLLLLLLTTPLLAQYTTVSGTITDPSGNAYANCRITASFVGQAPAGTGQYLLAGVSPFQKSVSGVQCDSTGAFSMKLADNAQVQPSPSQWIFYVCDSTGQHCFNYQTTITGSTQSLSSGLSGASVSISGAYVTTSGSYTWTGAQTLQGNALTFFKPAQYSSGLFATLSSPLTGNNTGTLPVNFNFQSYGFTNSGDANEDDTVFRMGWNIAPGGGLAVAGQAATLFEMEDYYNPTGGSCGATGGQVESHWGWVDTSGVVHRMVTFCGKTADGTKSQITITFGTDPSAQFNISSGATELWAISPSGTWQCAICSGSANTQLFSVADAAGADFIQLLGPSSGWQISAGGNSGAYSFYPTSTGFFASGGTPLGISSSPWGTIRSNGAYSVVLTATSAITTGQVVKIDSSNPRAVVVTATTDTGAGIPIGIATESQGAGQAISIAVAGIVSTPLLGTGTCTIGQFVIVDTTTAGDVKCTSTYTAGTVIGKALTAQSSVGSAVTVLVQPR